MVFRPLLLAVNVAAIAGLGLWLAPLQRPRAIVPGVYAQRIWFSPDARRLATGEYFGASGSRLRVWNVADGTPVAWLHDGDEVFTSVVFSPDGTEVTGQVIGNGRIVVWDAATGEERAHFRNRRRYGPAVYNDSGTLLVLGDKRVMLRLLDPATEEVALAVRLTGRRTVKPQLEERAGLAHRELTIWEGSWWIYDLTTGAKLTGMPRQSARELDLSANGEIAALMDSATGACEIVDTATQESTPVPALDRGRKLALAPTGEWLAAHLRAEDRAETWFTRMLPPSGGEVRVVHLPEGGTVARYRGGQEALFAPDGQTLAVIVNNDLSVQLWDFPPRKAWGWIIGGAAAAGSGAYVLLACQTRRAKRDPRAS